MAYAFIAGMKEANQGGAEPAASDGSTFSSHLDFVITQATPASTNDKKMATAVFAILRETGIAAPLVTFVLTRFRIKHRVVNRNNVRAPGKTPPITPCILQACASGSTAPQPLFKPPVPRPSAQDSPAGLPVSILCCLSRRRHAAGEKGRWRGVRPGWGAAGVGKRKCRMFWPIRAGRVAFAKFRYIYFAWLQEWFWWGVAYASSSQPAR
jgi:hypothetical protein